MPTFIHIAPSVRLKWLCWRLRGTRRLLGEVSYRHLQAIARTTCDPAEAMYLMARYLCHTGLHDYGIAAYETLLRSYGGTTAPPELYVAHYLQMLMFGSPEKQSNHHIYRQHVLWGRHFVHGKPFGHYTNPLTNNRRLKIGYTCHFITNSTSQTLLQPMLRAHHRERVEVFMYSDEPPNELTDDVRSIVEHWRDTHDVDHDRFCDMVRADRIDVLIELNGHGLFNRYPVIARRPAPVQAAYYNYACTTGVPGMDYMLVGEETDIRHLQPHYSETIFTKTGTEHAMPVGSHFPALTPPPVAGNGYITFCSFGQGHKVTRQQIFLWSEVLRRVPGSKFYMKAQVLDDPAKRAAFIHHFKDGGIDKSRLIMEGQSNYGILLRCYERADIALDTYPCNGGTTTTEAMIQGVPVISLIGDRYSSQTARNGIESTGHPELLCRSREEFVRKAVALAGDKEKIRFYREHLREDFRHSRRGDVDLFITELEDAYQEMWRRYLVSRERRI